MRSLALCALFVASCATDAESARTRTPEPPPPAPPPLVIVRIPASSTSPVAIGMTEGIADARSVASRVGDHVQFQDTIAGIAMANATRGAYFSFGAPFPKQALSVWVPLELYEKLPHHRFLIQRTVRVRGTVRETPTGPQIDLSALDDLQLLHVNETVLTRRDLESPTAIANFTAAIQQVQGRNDVDVLEELGDSLERMGRADRYGRMRMAYWDALRCPTGALLSRWRERHPQSHFPTLLEASAQMCAAWSARGGGTQSTVTPDGRRAFLHHAEQARRILNDRPSARVVLHSFVLLQKVAIAQGWPRDRFFDLFDEATALEPDYFALHENAATYLLPKWYGAAGDWERFAEQQRAKRPGAAGDMLYALIACELELEKPYFKRLFRASKLSWDVVASGLGALIEQKRGARYYKSMLAHFAWSAGDAPRLRAALDAIGDDPDMYVWATLQDVALARAFASRGKPYEL